MKKYKLILGIAKSGEEDIFSDGAYNKNIIEAIDDFNEKYKNEIEIYFYSCEKRSIILYIDTEVKIEETMWLRKLRGFTINLLKKSDLDKYVVNTRLWTSKVEEIVSSIKILSYNINGCGFSDQMLKEDFSNKGTELYGVFYKEGVWLEDKLKSLEFSKDKIIENTNKIREAIIREEPDIFILQEFQLQYQNLFLFPGYKIFNQHDRYDAKRLAANRVRLYIKEELANEFALIDAVEKTSEYFSKNTIFIKDQKNEVVIIGLHMPLGSNEAEKHWDYLLKQIKDLEKKHRVIVVGDLNVHLGETSVFRNKLEELKEIMFEMGPEDIITFIPNKKKLDYILTSWEQQSNMKVNTYNYSDHFMISSMIEYF